MKSISPVVEQYKNSEIKIAEHQNEYETVIALPINNGQQLMMRFELSDEEKSQVQEHGCIWLTVMNFNQPMQPVMIETKPPDWLTTADQKEAETFHVIEGVSG